MDDLAWFLALVAWMWLLQFEAREPAEAAVFENARDAGFGDADLGCDVLLGCGALGASFRRRRLWQAGFGVAMKGVLRIDRASHPRLRHRSDRPICRRSSGSY